MVSLSRRFALAFLLLVALPCAVVTVALSRLYVSALYETLAGQTRATAEEVSRGVQDEIDSASILAAALLHDPELGALVEEFSRARGAARLPVWSRIDAKVASFLIYSNRIGAVSIYLKDGSSYYNSNYPNLRRMPRFDRVLFAGAEENPGRVFLLDNLIGPEGNIGERNILSIAVCPSPAPETPVESILVMTRVPLFDELAVRAGPGGGDIVIFGRGGSPILSSLPRKAALELGPLLASTPVTRSFRDLRTPSGRWLATSAFIDAAGWNLVLLADGRSISNRIAHYSWYIFPAIAIIGLLSAAFVEMFFASIAAPIRALIAGMGRVGKGDYAARASSAGIAELEALTMGFNSMVDEIAALVVERERKERERLAAELEALRYQINPHFVANTLNSIRLMAKAARVDTIAQMSGDLMRVLSDSYAGAGRLVELSREVENVRSYVAIMKIRFGKRLEASFDIAADAGRLLSLRMILQPIVENCILHGFGGSDERTGRTSASRSGTITLSARMEEGSQPRPEPPEPGVRLIEDRNLVIEVSDDGTGMDRMRLAEVNGGVTAQGGLHRIGVANVRRRIALNFGVCYGLTMESESGKGTLVRFVLPAMERAAEPVETGLA